MRRALCLALLPLVVTGAAAGARAVLLASHAPSVDRAHVPDRLSDTARSAPIGWVTVLKGPGTTTTPGTTTPGPGTTPTTTEPQPTPTPTQPEPLPRRTGVQLDDTPAFSLAPTRNPVAAGSVEIVATNNGEDDHDLTVRDAGEEILASTGIIPSQGASSITVDLPAGDYTLYCSLPGHEAGGMRATLSAR